MKIAIFTNILNPYRYTFFNRCSQFACEQGDEFRVYAMTDTKSDRTWKYDDFKTEYTRLLKSRTIHIRGIAYLHFNSGLKKELKEYMPDVVVMAGSYLQPTVIELTRLQKKYHYKMFFWSESHFKEQRNYRKFVLKIREKIRKRVLSRMDGFWYPGERAKEFVDYYRREDAVLVQVPNTVENDFWGERIEIPEQENVKKAFGVTQNQKIIFSPARLSREKGILEFCDVLTGIEKDRYCWLIAGDGDLKEQIAKKIKELNLNVTLLGNKNPEEIRRLYHQADLFLLPSISDPNPLTCIEALWCGLPLFLSEHVGNVNEVVKTGMNGFEFSYSRLEEAAELFGEALEKDSAWYQAAGRYSLLLACEKFDQDKIARRTLSALKAAVMNDSGGL